MGYVGPSARAGRVISDSRFQISDFRKKKEMAQGAGHRAQGAERRAQGKEKGKGPSARAGRSGKVYAGRIGSNEWIFAYRTLKSEAVFRKVMKVTMELMLSEKWN
jgi:hypothetical protein